MSIRWWWWTLGAVGCILLGTIWASLSNPAVLPGLRGAVLNFGEWVETHHGALTLLATLFIAAFTGTLWWSTRQLWKAGEQQIALAKQTSEATQSVLGQTRVIERAYVKLSHEPPGVRFMGRRLLGDRPTTGAERKRRWRERQRDRRPDLDPEWGRHGGSDVEGAARAFHDGSSGHRARRATCRGRAIDGAG